VRAPHGGIARARRAPPVEAFAGVRDGRTPAPHPGARLSRTPPGLCRMRAGRTSWRPKACRRRARMRPTEIMKLARTAPALLLLALSVVVGGSLGCDTVATLVAPAVPALIDKATAPDLNAPDAPDSPLPDPPENRTCCFRGGDGAAKGCESRARCCSGRYSRNECEDAGGLWFNSADGCAGAC
jgi:hypothetical protein